ncbi:hypothetical protein WA538_001101 [Blastocystis sp. DL]
MDAGPKLYTVELKKDERIEEFGRCYIPKAIMRQERIGSGATVVFQTTMDDGTCSFVATAWEKRAPSNSVIELYPCSFQSSQNAFPETEFIVASIRRVVEQPKEALRLTVNTALQTIPSSFPRRLSQYLHRCPVFVGGHIRIAANTYTLSSSLPSGDIVTCLTDTTILFKQTDPATSSSSSQLQELDSLPPLHCPLPGLEDCYRVLVTTILYHRLFQREIESGSLRLFKGLLLSGDHGLGKTHIIHAAVAFCQPYLHLFFQTLTPSSLSAAYGSEARAIEDLFSRAAAVVAADPAALAVLLLEDIDRLCVRRSHASQTNVQVVAQLLTAIDGLLATPRVLVLATTTRPFDLDPALRRAGRFDREITLIPPSAEQRLAILKVLFPRVGLETAEWLPELALRTRGFTGADLELFATRAAASGAMSQLAQERVLSGVTPSAMKGEERVSGIPWESIGGMESVKELFRKTIEWPIVHAEAMRRFQLHVPRGILLYGPPGCAKTTLARALASQAHASFWTLSTAQVVSPYVGQSEFIIRSVFARARAAAPAVLFIDEIDAIVGRRGRGNEEAVQIRVMATFLTEMDGIGNSDGVLVVGATNRPEMIDDALLRPGRFDKLIYIPPPDLTTREAIFKVYTDRIHMDSSLDLKQLAEMTEGFSGADIENVCREAVYDALRRDITVEAISQDRLMDAIRATKPSITKEMVEHFVDFQNAYYKE